MMGPFLWELCPSGCEEGAGLGPQGPSQGGLAPPCCPSRTCICFCGGVPHAPGDQTCFRRSRAEATRTVALAWEASVLCSSYPFLITLLLVSFPHDDIRSPQPAVWFST